MARRYSNNKRSSRQKGGVPQQFLIIIVTFALGFITASVLNIENLSRWVSAQMLDHAQEKPMAKASTQQTQVPPKPKPKFEFYTLLTHDKVPNNATVAANRATTSHNVANNHASTAAVVAANTAMHPAFKATTSNPQQPLASRTEGKTSGSKGAYMVQVASFKMRQDADQMRGMLTLRGYTVQVVSISHQTRGIWYRVVVGPYANRNAAQKAQEALARNERLRGMVTLAGA